MYSEDESPPQEETKDTIEPADLIEDPVLLEIMRPKLQNFQKEFTTNIDFILKFVYK